MPTAWWGWLIPSCIGFVVGFEIALEVGRSIYNRKMDEIAEVAKKMKQILHSGTSAGE